MKHETIRLLKESGNFHKWSLDNYKKAKICASIAAKLYPNMAELWAILEGSKAKYLHDLIVKNA